jgi:choline dehydrogenase-like flavoprotein
VSVPVGDGRVERAELTSEERRLRRVIAAFGVLSVLEIGLYLYTGIFRHGEFPFVANSAAKDLTFAALAVVAVADIRRFSWAVALLIAAHVGIVIGLLLSAVGGNIHASHTFDDPAASHPELFLWLWVAAASFVVALFTYLYSTAQRARAELQYLGNAEFRALAALSEVLVLHEERVMEPVEVAKRVDDYLAGFRAQGKWRVRLALFALAFYPFLTLRPTFHMMSPEVRRRFVERRFLQPVASRGFRRLRFWRTAIQSMIRCAQQLSFIGYYTDPRAARRVGYLPFSQRPGYEEAMKRVRRDRPRVRCITPAEVDMTTLKADVAIVGSGAAGATLAYRLAEAGREVVILERGRHVDPSEFTESEQTQLANLYADGALQMSRDFRFQVGQGMCVGGSTVVNNAVCFEIPDRLLERWNDPDGLDAGLDPARVRDAFGRLRELLQIQRQPTNGALNPAWHKFDAGVRALGLAGPPFNYQVVDANIKDCLGSGYCNIGCAYGKKLSMLDHTLPEAQARFDGRVRIVAECRAERIATTNSRASQVECRLTTGERLTVRANTVVVSAGALASSVLLARSGIGGDLVGRNLGFNIASPLTADFDDELHSERGLQISHTLIPPDGEGFCLETWFNPIGSQSLFMPGWFDDHYRNMQRYAHMTCVGSVVGSRRNATVSPARFGDGLTLDYEPAPDDFGRLLDGLQLAGRIMFAGGARRVMPCSFEYHEFTRPEELEQLPLALRDNSDLSVNSAHPQGGNCLSRDPEKGVVDPTFRVFGYENLFVCDASVFPCPITVNPQLTVMALADVAADHVRHG